MGSHTSTTLFLRPNKHLLTSLQSEQEHPHSNVRPIRLRLRLSLLLPHRHPLQHLRPPKRPRQRLPIPSRLHIPPSDQLSRRHTRPPPLRLPPLLHRNSRLLPHRQPHVLDTSARQRHSFCLFLRPCPHQTQEPLQRHRPLRRCQYPPRQHLPRHSRGLQRFRRRFRRAYLSLLPSSYPTSSPARQIYDRTWLVLDERPYRIHRQRCCMRVHHRLHSDFPLPLFITGFRTNDELL